MLTRQAIEDLLDKLPIAQIEELQKWIAEYSAERQRRENNSKVYSKHELGFDPHNDSEYEKWKDR